MRLIGLENTRKIRACRSARSATKAIEYLRAGMAATTADDYGAIHAYNDRDGKYRCEAMRYCRTVEARVFTSLAQVRKWWAEWQKKIAAHERNV